MPTRGRIAKQIDTRNNTQQTPNKRQSSIPSQSSSHRSPSPVRLLRMHEQEQLRDLNSRCANLISHSRKLEEENAHLNQLVSSKLTDSYTDINKMKTLYDQELADVRRLLDATANEKATLQVEAGRLRAEAEEASTKLAHHMGELGQLRDTANTCTAQLASKTAQVDTMALVLHETSQSLKIAKGELTSLEHQVKTARDQLEVETLGRIEAENALQTSRETYNFNMSLDSEMNKSSNAVNGRKGESPNLEEIYSEVRDQLNEEMSQVYQKMEAVHDSKVSSLTCQVASKHELVVSLNEQVSCLSKRLTEANGDIKKYATEMGRLEKTLRDKQCEIDLASMAHGRELCRKEEQVDELRHSIHTTLAEHQDLYDAKLRLDTEIAAYRNLMESEEDRLNLVNIPRKRRRVDDSLNFRSVSYSTGAVQISDADELGEYVCVYNSGDTNVHLGDWTITQVVDTRHVDYHFPSNTLLPPLAYSKIWSTQPIGEEEALVLPHGIVWLTGDRATVRLFDGHSVEVSKREISKVNRLGGSPGEGANGCVMM